MKKLKFDDCKTCSKIKDCKIKIFYDDTSRELKNLIFPSSFTIKMSCLAYERNEEDETSKNRNK